MKASTTALELTIWMETQGENVPNKSFPDELGRTAVGYGHTIRLKENVNLPLSVSRAVILLLEDFKKVETIFRKHTQVSLKQHQVDALVCWGYQAMQGRCQYANETFETSTLMLHLIQGHLQLAGAEFDNWVFVNGRFNRRFAARRSTEKYLYTYGNLPPK